MGNAAADGTIGISEEHLELHAAARRWVEGHVDPKDTKALLDADADALPAFWDDLRGLGWLGLHLPEAHGGEGYGLAELAVVLEELGRACAPGPFLPTVLVGAVIAGHGNDRLRDEVLPGLAAGATIAAAPFGRPADGEAAGAGAAGIVATVAADGSLVLDGTVGPVPGGALADLLLVPVAVDGAVGAWCVLDAGADGVTVVERPSFDATRRVAEVACAAAAVPEHRLLAAPHLDTVVGDTAAVLSAAEACGSMAWCVDTAATYAADRVQFGRPIGQFQAVKHRCTQMLLQLEQARAAAWDAARAGTDGDEAELAACVAGAIVPGAAFAVAKDCLQVLGGIGYTWEHDAHHHIKRATAQLALLGGPAPWRARVAALARRGVRRSLGVELPPDAEPLRAEVRAFLDDVRTHDKADWNRLVAEAGYLVPYWPAPWGRDAGPLEQLVIDDEFAAARLRRPHLQVGGWVLPTLIAHGTPGQQERWIRPTLAGGIVWCQLFSEPGAGSDLASLSTRAVRDDERGGWVVTGQKVWTTMAHLASWGILLARTDPDAPKHEGITCFLLDMTLPGIDIRPLRELTGAELFNEVFLSEVFVPDDCVVGEVNAGWEAARTTLANERVSMGSGSSFGPGVESVLALVDRGGRGHDPVVADEVGGLVADGQTIAVLGLRSTLRALAGARPGAEASVRKLLATEHEQHTQEVGLALLGPDAAVVDGEAALWANGFLGNRALSIAGGTSDIQRNVVAERLLGLPKDPAPGE